jgi:predicted GNAT family N-acyltransferase
MLLKCSPFSLKPIFNILKEQTPMINQTAGLYAFREIKDETTLLAAFRLRYNIYVQQPHLRQLMAENAAEVDIDGYDVYSGHYGLYKINTESEEMIGYLRVIEQRSFPLVEEVLNKLKAEYDFIPPPRKCLFYSQEAYCYKEEVLKSYAQLARSICEPSRFIILKQYRSVGLAQFVIESIMVTICAAPYFTHGMVDCQKDHKSMYLRNGFEWKAEEKHPKVPSNPWNLLIISRAGVEKKMPSLEERIRQYETDGCFYHQMGSVDWQALRYLLVVVRRWARKVGII